MLKNFKNDYQSNSGIVRFSRLVMRISIDNLYQLYEFLLKKKNFKRFHNANKKTNLEVLSESFAFS